MKKNKIIITSTPKGNISIQNFMQDWFKLWKREQRKLKLDKIETTNR